MTSPTTAVTGGLRLADDISYAVHDIEDHVRAGLVPFFRMRHEAGASVIRRAEARMSAKSIAFSEDMFSDALERVLDDSAALWDYSGKIEDDWKLQDWVSGRISEFEHAIGLVDHSPWVEVDPESLYQIELLKAITWEYIIDGPSLAAAQEGQRALVRRLFEGLCTWLSERRSTVPKRLEELHALIGTYEVGFRPPGCPEDDYIIKRAVTDFLLGLTEPQTIDLFQRITGVSPATIFGGWL